MITLEKIIELDEKINRAVQVIEGLRNENNLLKNKIQGYHEKIEKLEGLVSIFKDDQDEIEAGIKNAVNTLSTMLNQSIEDTSLESSQIINELKECSISITESSPEEIDSNLEKVNSDDNIKVEEINSDLGKDNPSDENLSDEELEKLTQPEQQQEEDAQPAPPPAFDGELDIF